jgi:hypothetical protein
MVTQEQRPSVTQGNFLDLVGYWFYSITPLSGSDGAAYRTRTCDPLITNEVLYQLS